MQQPLISVVVPAYNHAAYIEAAIESVLSQSLTDLECIVIDDASSDETWDRIARIEDSRLRAFRHDANAGAHATLNDGLSRGTGRYLAILNSDDRFHPDRLERCLARLGEEGCDLVGSDIRLIDRRDAVVNEHWWLTAFAELKAVQASGADWVASLLEGNVFMTTSNMVFSRELWVRLAPFRDLRYVHDYDFLLRALLTGARLDWIDAPLLDYRLHDANTISERPLQANLECTALLREHLPQLIRQAADPVRALEHLGSQWARNERYEVEILRALQHEALLAKDQDWGAMVADRERWILERDGWIADRDTWIADRDTWIADRDAWIVERDATIAGLDASIKAIEAHPFRYVASAFAGRLRSRMEHFRNRAARLLRNTSLPTGSRIRRVGGFAVLRTEVESCGELRCLSFDVFDTLVQRCIEPPEWIHRRVAQELARMLGGQHDVESVWAARREAEAALRREAIAGGGDHECHFDSLLTAWVVRLCGRKDEALIARAEEIETRLERIALGAKPGAMAFLEWARARGLRLVAVSDMYLGEVHVREILNRCGLEMLLDAVYVSSEHGLGKYSTRLHARVLELEGFAPNQVLHVGDNLHADALAPCRIGMHAVYFDERVARLRRRRQKLASEMSARGGIWPGRMLGEIVAERLARDERAGRDDFYFRYGLEVLGPMFSLFTLGLVERLHQKTPAKICFLARDGYLLMKLFQRWCELDGVTALPECSYTYASRRVVASAAVAEGLRMDMVPIALSNPKQHGLESILKTYGLLPEDFTALADEHGLKPMSQPLADWEDARLKAFLGDERVQQLVRESGQKGRNRLEAYFEQEGFFKASSVVFVDIGWNGTIQHFMGESFGHRPDYPGVSGYYFALVNSFHRVTEKGGPAEGILLDGKRGNPCERAASDFEELFEQCARSPEATTLGYAADADGWVSPVLKDEDAADRIEEQLCNPPIAEMQAGVMLHLEHFHAARELSGFDFDALKPYVLGLIERAVVHPTQEEVEYIGRLAHTEDFGHDHLLDMSAQRVTWRDMLRPRQLSARLRTAAWRYAPFARFRSPLPALIARVAHLRHIWSQGR